MVKITTGTVNNVILCNSKVAMRTNTTFTIECQSEEEVSKVRGMIKNLFKTEENCLNFS